MIVTETGENVPMQLSFFGGPVLRRAEGDAVPLTPAHQRLLTLVWGHGPRGLPRSEAIWLLWESEDDRRSRHRLRQALHDLAGRTGGRLVTSDAEDRLSAPEGGAESDLRAFEVALQDGRLTRAWEISRAGFAPLLGSRGMGDAYGDWLTAKREGYRRRLREAAAWHWDRFHPLGAWEETLEAAEVLFALDPDSDIAASRAVEARARTGNREAALAAVEHLKELGRDELPPELARLVERVSRMEPVAAFTGGTRVPKPPPLVGRRADLAAARGMLGRIDRGGFELLLFVGEGGAGKTRLMDEIWKEANLAGFRCLQARPVEVERGIPLNPLLDMLGDPTLGHFIRDMEDPWRAVVASLLPELPEGMDPPVVPPVAESSLNRRLLDAFATLLTDMAADRPLLLFIDDLHWVDATTIAVLQFVQRRWSTGALGIVAAVRPELVGPRDGVRRYLDGAEDLPVTRVHLGDLNDHDATTLVRLAAEEELDDATVARLCAFGGRNPFYLIELTRDHVAGKTQLPELPTDAITLPISLKQLLDPRVERLGEEARAAAAYLAVWGRSGTLDDLATLTGATLAEVAGQAEELEACRLAHVERGRISFAHELIRGAIYQALSAARRAFLHGQVAAFLEGFEPKPVGELALHFDRAGSAPGAARYGRLAADRALESGAVAEAAAFLQLVLDNESDDTLKAEATGDLARVLHMNREIIRANPLLELAATRLRAVGRHDRALRMDIRRVEGLAELGAAPLSELLDRLGGIKQAARSSGDDEALALALDCELHVLHRNGEVEQMNVLFDHIRNLTQSESPAAACTAHASMAVTSLFGDVREALACAREAVRIAESVPVPSHLLRAKARLFLALLQLGETKTAEALATVQEARQLAATSGDLAMRFELESNVGLAHMDACEFDEAQHHFERAGKLLTTADAAVLRLNYHYNLAELALLRREYDDSLRHLAAVEGLITPSARPRNIQLLVHACIGLCALEMGELNAAREREQHLKDLPATWHFDPTPIVLFHAKVRERRGAHKEALAVCSSHSARLENKLPIGWMRLQTHSALIARRLGDQAWRSTLEGVRELALRLGQGIRVRELDALLRQRHR